VRTGRRRRSFGFQSALGRASTTRDQRDAVLIALVDRVSRRMRAAGRVGRTVVLRLRFGDFSRATRSHTLSRPTAQTRVILTAARPLLEAATPVIERRGLTLVGITVANLDGAGGLQLTLPFDQPADAALDAVLDAVRDRFGGTALTRATLLTSHPRLATWLHPEDVDEADPQAPPNRPAVDREPDRAGHTRETQAKTRQSESRPETE